MRVVRDDVQCYVHLDAQHYMQCDWRTEEMTLAELSKKYGVHPNQISTWKRAAIENMATAFTRRGADPGKGNEAEIEKLHSKIGQLVVERDFLANASVQLLGTRGKKW